MSNKKKKDKEDYDEVNSRRKEVTDQNKDKQETPTMNNMIVESFKFVTQQSHSKHTPNE